MRVSVPKSISSVLIGCGKSSTLRMIAGLEEISEGEILIGDNVINEVEPKDRDIAMVFETYALYPHKTVYANMAFPLRVGKRNYSHSEIKERVRKASKILEISELLDRYPKQLSGGQRQRVAIGRAIVREPQVFLMDEPISHLDAKLRTHMRGELKHLQKVLESTHCRNCSPMVARNPQTVGRGTRRSPFCDVGLPGNSDNRAVHSRDSQRTYRSNGIHRRSASRRHGYPDYCQRR